MRVVCDKGLDTRERAKVRCREFGVSAEEARDPGQWFAREGERSPEGPRGGWRSKRRRGMRLRYHTPGQVPNFSIWIRRRLHNLVAQVGI